MRLDPSWIMAICAVLTFAIGIGVALWRFSLRLHAVTVPIHAVREQVQNSHETNLREDIDEIRDMVGKVLTAQAVTTSEVKSMHRRMDRIEDRLDRA